MSEVSDYTALLAYLDNDSLRWNGQASVGTQVVITYSFTEAADLEDPLTYDPYGATEYWSYNAQQQSVFRDILDQYEAVSGVKFVEIQGDAMINVFGSSGSSAGGWAHIAQSTETYTGSGDIAVNSSTMSVGQYGYQLSLHELGHAMGLEHPHEGGNTLEESVNTQANTVMTYNIEHPYVSDLGTFDVQALQHLYGDANSFDDWSVSVNSSNTVIIRATSASETVLATGQNTKIYAKGGRDEVFGREGDDYLNGGSGSDTVIGAYGEDRILGKNGHDLLIGDVDQNDYSGLDGNSDDEIYGNKGNDTIYGGRGDDTLIGAQNNDQIFGGYGDDDLQGGNGKDTLQGGDGADTMSGGNGDDIFIFVNADAYEVNVITDFTAGADRIDLSEFSFMNINTISVSSADGNSTVSYSNWMEIELTGYTGSLSDSDFIFA